MATGCTVYVRMYSIAAYVVSESICHDVYIIDYFVPFMSLTASTLSAPSMVTMSGDTTTTTVSVSWSPVSGATGYYVSYQRQDLGIPPVVTPQYERIMGGASTNVTLSGLEPGTTYRIRVWSTDGTSVSSEAREMNVTTVESGESALYMLQGVTV